MMRTLLRLAAALMPIAVLAASCSGDDDVAGKENPAAIGFSIVAPKTKGTEFATAAEISSMGVYATLTHGDLDGSSPAPDYLFNQEVTHNADGTWTYSPVKYWPDNGTDKVSFFAYAPYVPQPDGNLVYTGVEQGFPMLAYTVAQSDADQKDLLVSVPARNCTKKTGSVSFTLKHALTKVTFTIRSDENITVKSLRLEGTVNSGKLTFDGTDAGFHWSGFAGSADYGASLPDEGVQVVADSETATELATFFLLPEKGACKYRLTYTQGAKTVEKTDVLPDTPAWTAGGVVNYTLNLGMFVTVGDVLCVDDKGDSYTVNPDDYNKNIHKAVGIVIADAATGIQYGDKVENYDGKLTKIHGYAIALEDVKAMPFAWSIFLDVRVKEPVDKRPIFNGYELTKRIENMENYSSETYPACWQATHYVNANGIPNQSSGWYLGSEFQYGKLYFGTKYLAKVQSSLTIAGNPFKMEEFNDILSIHTLWTSTEYRWKEEAILYYKKTAIAYEILFIYSTNRYEGDFNDQDYLKTDLNYVRPIITF